MQKILPRDVRIFNRRTPNGGRLLTRTENTLPKGSVIDVGEPASMIYNHMDHSAVPITRSPGDFLLIADINP